MARTEEQLAAMRQKTRDTLLSAAVRVFTKRGFAATSMQDIADDANVSVGLIYRHFATKDELFETIIDFAIDGLKNLSLLFSQDIAPNILFEQLASEVVADLHNQQSEFSRFMILTSHVTTSDELAKYAKKLTNQSKQTTQKMADAIKRGQDQSLFVQGDPLAMAQYYLAAIQGMAELQLALGDAYIPPTVAMINAFLIKENV